MCYVYIHIQAWCAYVVPRHVCALMCYPPARGCADVLSGMCVCWCVTPPARVCAHVLSSTCVCWCVTPSKGVCWYVIRHVCVLICYPSSTLRADVLSSTCVCWCVVIRHVCVLMCYPACVCADVLSDTRACWCVTPKNKKITISGNVNSHIALLGWPFVTQKLCIVYECHFTWVTVWWLGG